MAKVEELILTLQDNNAQLREEQCKAQATNTDEIRVLRKQLNTNHTLSPSNSNAIRIDTLMRPIVVTKRKYDRLKWILGNQQVNHSLGNMRVVFTDAEGRVHFFEDYPQATLQLSRRTNRLSTRS